MTKQWRNARSGVSGQIILALLTVAAYASLQLRLARPDDLHYLLPNLVSSVGLTVAAVVAFQLGFVISNGLWAAVSTAGLIRLARRRWRGNR